MWLQQFCTKLLCMTNYGNHPEAGESTDFCVKYQYNIFFNLYLILKMIVHNIILFYLYFILKIIVYNIILFDLNLILKIIVSAEYA